MKQVTEFLKNVVGNYLCNLKLVNIQKTSYKKRALLSYITFPFFPFNKKNVHTLFLEAQSWVEVISELGFDIDVISYNSKWQKTIDLSKYDLIVGFGDVFQRYFEYFAPQKKITTIYYGTGMHVCHQNNITLKRVKELYQKRGVWLTKSSRFVEKTWSHQTTLVDAMIILGNEVSEHSYRKYYTGPIYLVPVPFYVVFSGEEMIENRYEGSEKHFLWFGGSGLVHKGLDLVLEYFSQQHELILHVVGPIDKEPDFVKVFYRELYETPNIKTYGFLSIQSDMFKNVLLSCDFVIFPSCSEAGCASVITAMGNGGLVPIVTKETTVNTGNQIWIEGFSEIDIDKAVRKALEIDRNTIKYMQYENVKYALQHHSIENYKKKLKDAVINILKGEINYEL